MNRNPVGWFEIYVQDLDRAKTFYEMVLSVELTKLESPMPELEMLAFPMNMETGGASGVLVKWKAALPVAWARWSIFPAKTAASKHHESIRPVAKSHAMDQPLG